MKNGWILHELNFFLESFFLEKKNACACAMRVADLEFKKYPTCPDFHFEKTGEKDFWQRITCDQIITEWLEHQSCQMLKHTREGTTIVTQQEKVTK